MPKVPQAHRQQERVVEYARDHRIHDLDEEPRAPIVPLLFNGFLVQVRELVGCKSILQWHAAVKLQMHLHNARVIGLLVPGRERSRGNAARHVRPGHSPRLAQVQRALHDA